jgi:hypothetical protein
MTSSWDCDRVREVAPELALGILAGEERARALQHLAGCGRCRRHVAELAEVVDELLALTPSREPPLGFESRVVKRLTAQLVRARGRRLVAGMAAVVALAAALSGLGVHVATEDDRRLAAHYRRALQQADGQYFGAVQLRDAGGHPVGTVFAYEGSPAWVFVVIRSSTSDGDYAVEVATRSGTRLTLGTLSVRDGTGSWGRALPVALRDVAGVRLLDGRGDLGFEVAFTRRSG